MPGRANQLDTPAHPDAELESPSLTPAALIYFFFPIVTQLQRLIRSFLDVASIALLDRFDCFVSLSKRVTKQGVSLSDLPSLAVLPVEEGDGGNEPRRKRGQQRITRVLLAHCTFAALPAWKLQKKKAVHLCRGSTRCVVGLAYVPRCGASAVPLRAGALSLSDAPAKLRRRFMRVILVLI